MAGYSDEELADGWEFKIVKSATGAFGKPGVLQSVVEDEAQAGWELLEKFDDNRIRFKRPRSARARDDMLPEGVDPYRTVHGWSDARVAFTIMAVIGLVVGAFALAAYLVPTIAR